MGRHKQKGNSQKNQVCWICYHPSHKKFSPCQCKGTLQYVHQDCLSKWATTQYKSFQFKSRETEGLKIQCPNCKQNLIYSVNEKWKKSKLSSLDFFDSREKVTLIVLITIQLLVLAHDIIFTINEELPANKQRYLNWLHVVHFGTVAILLGAGFYNVVDLTLRETELYVHKCQQ